MIEEAPDPKEIAHFHFNQLRTLKLTKDDERVPKESINNIAAASKYGLLFVGISGGFKVLKLENILDLDEDKENKNIEENYYSQVVATDSPMLLTLSADQKTLAVCLCRNGSVLADMYDIAAFADPEETPVPFHTSLLSGNNSKLKDFIWNPVIEGMYAYCMSDGSLHVHELTGMKFAVVASVANANANAACWSPKGKQLVVGKKDGSFSQYKPTLQEVKNIPPPSITETLTIVNICWVSTAQFAVLYVPEGENVSPYLFIISTPKGAPIVYTNFYDICLGNSSSTDQRYFMHHESAWGILICASTDSIEITVLGDSPQWVPWEIRDDCRALLPSKNGAKHAVAMGVMYCSQRRIVISETEAYAPMPIIFYLTDNGLLVSYYMVNSASGAISLVRPSTPIDRENERKRPDVNQNIKDPVALPNIIQTSITTSAVYPQPTFQSPAPVFQSPPPIITSFPSAPPPAFGSFGQNNVPQNTMTFGAIPFTSFTPPPPKPLPSSSSGVSFVTPGISPEAERFHKTSKAVSVITPTPPVPKDNTAGVRQLAVAQRSIATTKTENEKGQFVNADSSLKPTLTPISHIDSGDASQIQKGIVNQDTYLTAIIDEMQNFEKELQDLKKSSDLLTSIGSQEEMADLQSSTLKFEEFQNEMTETMTSLNNDIHSLKNSLLESFVLVEEAYSKERRRNDHSFISMLKDRALDPITAKRMQTIEQHYLYLSTQLQEVSNKLDLDWFEYLEKKKANQKRTHHISSAEAIYKTVVNNQRIIFNLRNTIDVLSKKAADKKMERISRRKTNSQFNKRSDPEALSKLADAFLQAKINTSEEEKPQFQKKMSADAQNVLKKYLASSSVTSVRPTIVYSPSQSRFLSNSLMYSNRLDKNKNQMNLQEKEQAVVLQDQTKEEANLKANSVMKPVIIDRPPSLIHSNSTERLMSEKAPTLISKPQVTSAIEFEKLRLQNQGPVTTEDKNVENHFTKFAPPSMGFTAPKSVVVATPQIISTYSIDNTLYEDITPPDSPSLSNYPTTSEARVLEVSFNKGSSDVQIGSSTFTTDKNGLSENLDNVQSLQDAKLNSSNLKTFTTMVNTPSSDKFFTPFSIKTPVTAMAETPTQKEAVMPESNKTTDFSSNQLAKPSFMKPTTASGFSFLSPSATTSSFPNSSTVSSFFTSPAKKEDTYTKPGSTILNLGSIDTKPILTTSGGLTITPISNTSGNLNKEAQNQLGSIVNESTPSFQKSVFPLPTTCEESGNGFKFTLPQTSAPSSFFPTSGNKASSFFSFSGNKTPVTTKELTFFQPNIGIPTTASQPPAVLSKTSLPQTTSIPTIKTVAVTPTVTATTTDDPTKTVEANINKVSPIPNLQVTSQSSETVSSSPNQSPINLSYTSQANVSSGEGSSSIAEVLSQDASALKLNLLAEVAASVSSIVSKADLPVSSEVPKPASGQIISTSAPTESISATVLVPASNVLTQPSMPLTVAQSTSVTIVSSPQPLATTTTSPVFGVIQTTTTASEPFTTAANLPGSVPTTSSFFSSPVATSASAFGPTSGTTPSFFGQPASTQSSFFGKSTETPVFGQSTLATTSPFGSSLTSTSSGIFTQAAGTFFSTPPGNQNSVFGSQPDAPAFGKSAFGQTQGSFGLAKAVFGQQNTTPAPVFGQPATPPSNTAPFGQSSGNSLFGQGSFFSGLGGKPSAENANKNVFAVGNLSKPATDPSVFGASAFGAKTGVSFSGGSFSSGGGGSVAQTGFGAFQQSPQKSSGFGAAPTFGGAPSFGSAPAFGSPPSFGSGSPLSSVFGTQQSSPQANFSNFANASSPTFGSLATQGPAFGQPSSPFGGGSVFGNTPSFGASSGFGSPGAAPASNSSAFTQWRN